jgi:hypothetical protein
VESSIVFTLLLKYITGLSFPQRTTRQLGKRVKTDVVIDKGTGQARLSFRSWCCWNEEKSMILCWKGKGNGPMVVTWFYMACRHTSISPAQVTLDEQFG